MILLYFYLILMFIFSSLIESIIKYSTRDCTHEHRDTRWTTMDAYVHRRNGTHQVYIVSILPYKQHHSTHTSYSTSYVICKYSSTGTCNQGRGLIHQTDTQI